MDGIEFQPAEDKNYNSLMDEFYFSKAFDYVWEKVQDLNKEIDNKKPWELAKEPEKHDELIAILNGLVSSLLQATKLLYPFLPDVSASITEIFTGTAEGADGKILPPKVLLFPKDH